MAFADLFRGVPGLMQPPVADIEAYWTPAEKFQAGRMLGCSVIGSRDTVRAGLNRLVAETGADELMIVCDVFDPAKRLKSLEIVAELMA